MSQAPVLAHYCPEKDTIVSADTSSYGLGTALLQVQDNGSTKATAYAPRSLTSTEQRYAQIGKEAHGHTKSLQITSSEMSSKSKQTTSR